MGHFSPDIALVFNQTRDKGWQSTKIGWSSHSSIRGRRFPVPAATATTYFISGTMGGCLIKRDLSPSQTTAVADRPSSKLTHSEILSLWVAPTDSFKGEVSSSSRAVRSSRKRKEDGPFSRWRHSLDCVWPQYDRRPEMVVPVLIKGFDDLCSRSFSAHLSSGASKRGKLQLPNRSLYYIGHTVLTGEPQMQKLPRP